LQRSRQRKTKWHSCIYWNNKNPHEWRFGRNLSRFATETFFMEGTTKAHSYLALLQRQWRRRLDSTTTLEV